jgi:putative membrane protein
MSVETRDHLNTLTQEFIDTGVTPEARTNGVSVVKGLVAGVAGGLVASAVMNQFQSFLSKLMEDREGKSHGAQSEQPGPPERGLAFELQKRGVDDPEDNAAIRTGNAVSELVFDHHLTKEGKERGGEIAHYAMGAASGAIYGVVAEVAPVAAVGQGIPFGAAVWLIADEAIVPAAGLSKGPAEYPISTHAYALASHLVYGLTTEVVRRTVRRALGH